jgi:hypothetical protein
MATLTAPYSAQMAYSQPHITISPPPFLHIDNTSVSFCTISNYVPNIESILSSCCSPNAAPTSMDEKCFGANAKVVTSDSNSISWRNGKKKKKTVSAALLIALGIAGIVMG